MDPDEAERRFGELLEEAGLPRFNATFHDPARNELQFSWDHGLTLHVDLTREVIAIDDWERAAILGLPVGCHEHEPTHVFVPGSGDDPRTAPSIPGVVIHRGAPLHPDDVTTHNGIPVTSPSRTLIDCAEFLTAGELRAAFARASTSSRCGRGTSRWPFPQRLGERIDRLGRRAAARVHHRCSIPPRAAVLGAFEASGVSGARRTGRSRAARRG